MPVFETGAFNHSATCPGEPSILDRRRRRVNDLAIVTRVVAGAVVAARAKESREQLATFVRPHTGEHFRTVIELWMTQQVGDRAGHPCLRIPCTEYHAVQS